MAVFKSYSFVVLKTAKTLGLWLVVVIATAALLLVLLGLALFLILLFLFVLLLLLTGGEIAQLFLAALLLLASALLFRLEDLLLFLVHSLKVRFAIRALFV